MSERSAILGLSLIAILATGSPAGAHAQSSSRATTTTDVSATGTIEGVVVLPSGRQVNGQIKIILSTLNDPGITVFTDSNGRFVFSNLAAGTYYLEAIGDTNLYDPGSEQVRLSRGVRASLTVYLREKNRAALGKPGGVVSAHEIDPRAPATAKKQFEEATKLAGEARLQEAIERYKRAIKVYPQYLFAHNDLGVQYLNLRRLAEAESEFETCIEIDPKAFNPRLNLGIVLVEQKRYIDAFEQLRLAVSIDSSSPSAHLYLGIVAVETDELSNAEREFGRALSLGGLEYSIAHYYLAKVHMKKGEREAAIREFEAYLDTSPSGEEAARARQLLEKLKP